MKPWQYPVSVSLPHLDACDGLESLRAVIDLLRLQTVRPYLLVVDTGSPWSVVRELEQLRAPDLEVHYIRAHGFIHGSSPVCAALDLTLALCRTKYLFLTHTDVFPLRRDLLDWLMNQCSASCPVVGWEMSPRQGTDRWKGTVSHTATMLHVPTIRGIGAGWNMERYFEAHGPHVGGGWPDTESTFRHCLDCAAIQARLLGPELNYERQKGKAEYIGDDREWWDHPRSYTCSRAYVPGSPFEVRASSNMREALPEARQRVKEWREANGCSI